MHNINCEMFNRYYDDQDSAVFLFLDFRTIKQFSASAKHKYRYKIGEISFYVAFIQVKYGFNDSQQFVSFE